MKISIISVFLFIHAVIFGQTNKQLEGKCNRDNKSDTAIVMHVKMQEQAKKETGIGYYKVTKIDTFPGFYLIFVIRNDTRYTIYSENNLIVKGQKLEVDNTYFFELSCKDTLSNGMCVIPMANVTYFGKYLGSEIGKLSRAKNLMGLIIPNRINIKKSN